MTEEFSNKPMDVFPKNGFHVVISDKTGHNLFKHDVVQDVSVEGKKILLTILDDVQDEIEKILDSLDCGFWVLKKGINIDLYKCDKDGRCKYVVRYRDCRMEKYFGDILSHIHTDIIDNCWHAVFCYSRKFIDKDVNCAVDKLSNKNKRNKPINEIKVKETSNGKGKTEKEGTVVIKSTHRKNNKKTSEMGLKKLEKSLNSTIKNLENKIDSI